jgi:CheY-like chemotaxis protein
MSHKWTQQPRETVFPSTSELRRIFERSAATLTQREEWRSGSDGPRNPGLADAAFAASGRRAHLGRRRPRRFDERTLTTLMLKQTGASVTAVASAREAPQMLSAQRPDVLVSDIGLSDGDGYSLMIREHEAEHGGFLPAISLTGYVRADDRAQALAAGFHAHLSKPVDPFALIESLQMSQDMVRPDARVGGCASTGRGFLRNASSIVNTNPAGEVVPLTTSPSTITSRLMCSRTGDRTAWHEGAEDTATLSAGTSLLLRLLRLSLCPSRAHLRPRRRTQFVTLTTARAPMHV